MTAPSAIQSTQLASPPHRARECANARRNPRCTVRNRAAENRLFLSSDSIRPSFLRDVVPRSGFISGSNGTLGRTGSGLDLPASIRARTGWLALSALRVDRTNSRFTTSTGGASWERRSWERRSIMLWPTLESCARRRDLACSWRCSKIVRASTSES